MKKLLLLLFALPIVAMGQTNEPQTRDELRLIEKIYYDRGVYIATDEDRERLKDLVFEMKADSTLKIHVIGFGDKWGGKEVNDRFSYVRAMYIADWIKSCRVPREQIVFVGEGVDSLAVNDTEARRVEVSQVVKAAVIVAETKAQTETETKTETETETKTETQPDSVATQQDSTPTPATPTKTKNKFEWNHFNLRTNLLYWLGGMMNIGTEYKNPESDFGYLLNAGYSLFGNTDWEHNLGGWFVAPEVRYYFPSNDQWFVGAQFLAAGYNIKLSDTGRQGTVLGGGVVGGYKLTLSDSFDMDFTLGLGYGHLKYDAYYHDDATNTNPYIEKGITKNSLIPIQAGVNLIWKIK